MAISTDEPSKAEADSAGGEGASRADGDGKATDQVGRDLRDSAETVRNLLHDAFQRLRSLDQDSPVTALVAQAVERFQQVHRDIDGLTSDLDSRDQAGPEPESPAGRPD